MKINEILLRDPFILPYEGVYYMYGSRTFREPGQKQLGFDVYNSTDLVNWSEPVCILDNTGDLEGYHKFWAPEVYCYNGKFYLFASVASLENDLHSTWIFVSDTPDGKFSIHNQVMLTPKDWNCIDGTLYIEDDIPYMIFVRQWTQVKDGAMYAVQLSDDFTRPIGEPKLLFNASQANWAKKFNDGDYVTDGPFLFKEDGVLYMLWSSYSMRGYEESIAYSESGLLYGEWKQTNKLLYDGDGGHGMLFEDFNGSRKLVLHSPNMKPASPVVFDFIKTGIGNYECKSL